ncbi:Probable dual specificity protein phosphatase DDB_G0281963 [Galdieria sulphuraria]|nr:Probable dual specificity protein phosphatase DDB_G0281963 [Galdieria sulphuraria]
MAITPEQLEKLAFMEAPNKHCSAKSKRTKYWKSYLIEHKEYKAQTRLVEGQIEEKGSAENPSCRKLSCPKCKCRIGSYTWFGEKCSCGNWVTPSLKIPKRRVDFTFVACSLVYISFSTFDFGDLLGWRRRKVIL